MQKTFNKIELQCDSCGAKAIIEYVGDVEEQTLAYDKIGWKAVAYRAGDGPGYDYYDSSYHFMDLCPMCSSINAPHGGMFNKYGR